MKTELTERQKEILNFIQKFLQKSGYPPTIREIGKEFKISSTFGVKRHLDALVKKGYLSIDNNISRGLSLRNVPEVVLPEADVTAKGANVLISVVPDIIRAEIQYLPVVGRVAAGFPITAIENIEGNIPVDSSLIRKNPDCFALRVKGDSMINAGIFEGDLVIVSPQKFANNGEIVVALIGDEATVKRFHRQGDEIVLIAENTNYQPIIINNREDFSIVGRVIGIQRWYN